MSELYKEYEGKQANSSHVFDTDNIKEENDEEYDWLL